MKVSLGYVLGAIGIILVAYFMGKREQRLRQEVQSWTELAQHALKESQHSQQLADSLQGVEALLRNAAAHSRRRVDTLTSTAESLLVIHDTVRAVPFLQDALVACRTAEDADRQALSTCDQRVALERSRADSLAAVLRAGIPLVNCHWLGIGFLPRCASRTLSFFVGAGAGVVGSLLLKR